MVALEHREARESDIDSICDTFFSAFAGDYVMGKCFPDIPTVRAFWVDGLRKDIADPKHHIRCIVDKDSPGSPVIAYANWQACDEDTIQEGPLCPEGGDEEVAEIFFPRLRKRKIEIMGGRKYWYLACLCCRPTHQGQGAGRLLLKYGVELADSEGKEIYLEASPPGVPVYTKYGWREQDRVIILDGAFTEILMKREAKS
ncbi:acetyltransferase-like protein [Exophiala viscosa]|uniref:Acetyltransferase-like protein n=1 Tax=Exophiala viscosa TaxID=2486360 RepID=A0AAN6IFE1_9EURO|nr:acetyltransferase-like protein [Exophiala viscosa]KAI1624123.1 acetyltransferase-like protein [Exophiala viscosa]